MPFKVGDTVQLKSGSPLMTIAEIDGEVVFCVWFTGQKKEQGSFTAGTIKIVKPA
jgi:uncharacterized protein YodC (DUF2158 family)